MPAGRAGCDRNSGRNWQRPEVATATGRRFDMPFSRILCPTVGRAPDEMPRCRRPTGHPARDDNAAPWSITPTGWYEDR